MDRFLLHLTLLLFLSTNLHTQDSNLSFTKEEIAKDLAFLKLNLEKYHPNLYQYSDKETIHKFFKELSEDIDTPLTTPESFRLIASTSVVVKDGHYAFTPNAQVLENFYTTSKILPLDLYFDGMDSYVLRNFSDNDKILASQKVLSINGRAIGEIEGEILDCLLRDGDNKTYPKWIFNNFLRAYYDFCFGNSEEYIIRLEDAKKGVITEKVSGLNYTQITQAKKARYPNLYHVNKTESGLKLDIDQEQGIARMTIPSFDKAILKKTYRQKFKPIIKDFMQQIKTSNAENLMIDVRGNQGGEVSNAIYLLRHLIDEPFVTVLFHQKVNKKNYLDLSNRLKKANSSVDGIKKPITKNQFQGKIYVLIDGGSFSASGIFAQALKKYNKATFIGEETGGNAYTLVGLPEKKITLPNTGIQVIIPRVQFNLQENIPKNTSGVFPDVKTTIAIENLIENRDIDYEEVIKLIKK